MNDQQRELRDVIRQRIEPGMSADEIADRMAGMFMTVRDEWIEHDVTTMGNPLGCEILCERWLVARVHRETVARNAPRPNRTVDLA